MADKLKQLEMLKSQYVPTTEFYSQIIDSYRTILSSLRYRIKINSWSSGSVSIFGYEQKKF
jgi:two-component system CheB/CheR fusion protein